MERINDLINPKNTNLKIKETKQKNIIIDGLTTILVENEEQMETIIKACLKNRITVIIAMNEYSSRSHCILIVTLIKKNIKLGTKNKGKLYLIDLAGSEKNSKTNTTGLNLEEAKKINKY